MPSVLHDPPDIFTDGQEGGRDAPAELVPLLAGVRNWATFNQVEKLEFARWLKPLRNGSAAPGENGRYLVECRVRKSGLLNQATNNRRLPNCRHGAIASERRQDLIVAKVLAPRLELLRRAAALFGESDERVTQPMRGKIGQARNRKATAEHFADRASTAPMAAVQPRRLKVVFFANFHTGRRKQRIIRPPKQLLRQVGSPLLDDPANVVAYGKEPRIEALAELGGNLAGVLNDATLGQIEVLQLQSDDRTVAGTCQEDGTATIDGLQADLEPFPDGLPAHVEKAGNFLHRVVAVELRQPGIDPARCHGS